MRSAHARWPLFLALALVATMLARHPGAAGTVNITSGSLDMGPRNGPLSLQGDRGFTFESRVSDAGGVFEPTQSCNDAPNRCVPGATVGLHARWVGSDVTGTATLDGVTYSNVGGQSSPNSMSVDFTGSAVLPAMAASATVTAGFAFSGTFFHSSTGGTTVQETLTGSGTATLSLVPNGAFPESWFIERVVYRFAAQPLPTGWLAADVGAVGRPGSSTFTAATPPANSTYTVTGAGADIWGSADAFQFAYRPVAADVEIVARVDSEQNTHTFAKAGVMLRGSLDASSWDVLLDVRPGGGLEFMTRSANGGSTAFMGGGSAAFPIWLKLWRRNTAVLAYVSPDGVSWTQVGPAVAAPTGSALVGLAVTSHDVSATNTATFTNVDVRTLPGGWSRTDIGAVGLTGLAAEERGLFRVAGAGSDIWGVADSFTAVTTTLSGDGRLTALVRGEQNTHPFAKAGIFVSASLLPDATRVILDIRPDGSVEFMARFGSGQAMQFIAGGSVAFPSYVRLARTGDRITGFTSSTGSTWTEVGSVPVTLPATLFGGLAVTSHDPGVLNVASFDNVSVEAAAPPAPSNLLQNPGFEGYVPPALGAPGWISDAFRQTPARSESLEPRSGANNGACRTTTSLDCGIYQDVTAPADGTYTFTIYANASRAGAWVGVNVNGAGVQSAPVEPRGTGIYGSPYVFSFAANAGDVIRVWLYSPASPGSAVIDDGDLRF